MLVRLRVSGLLLVHGTGEPEPVTRRLVILPDLERLGDLVVMLAHVALLEHWRRGLRVAYTPRKGKGKNLMGVSFQSAVA